MAHSSSSTTSNMLVVAGALAVVAMVTLTKEATPLWTWTSPSTSAIANPALRTSMLTSANLQVSSRSNNLVLPNSAYNQPSATTLVPSYTALDMALSAKKKGRDVENRKNNTAEDEFNWKVFFGQFLAYATIGGLLALVSGIAAITVVALWGLVASSNFASAWLRQSSAGQSTNIYQPVNATVEVKPVEMVALPEATESSPLVEAALGNTLFQPTAEKVLAEKPKKVADKPKAKASEENIPPATPVTSKKIVAEPVTSAQTSKAPAPVVVPAPEQIMTTVQTVAADLPSPVAAQAKKQIAAEGLPSDVLGVWEDGHWVPVEDKATRQ